MEHSFFILKFQQVKVGVSQIYRDFLHIWKNTNFQIENCLELIEASIPFLMIGLNHPCISSINVYEAISKILIFANFWGLSRNISKNDIYFEFRSTIAKKNMKISKITRNLCREYILNYSPNTPTELSINSFLFFRLIDLCNFTFLHN